MTDYVKWARPRGPIAAMVGIGDKVLCVFKRNAMLPFKMRGGVIVRARRRPFVGFGAKHHGVALAHADGYIYAADERGAWRWRPGMEKPERIEVLR